MDRHSTIQRSFNMSRIRSKNTKPELILRKLLYSNRILGYRVHPRIFGKPDIFYPKYKLAVFVDGCFWHKCSQCYVEPVSRKLYWIEKINNNIKRDMAVNSNLTEGGYKVLRIWEHQIKKNPEECITLIKKEMA
jgi:DNA mismatch endonuclease (patch repair protein)